jgi:cytoskeletal protein RodZ
MTTRQGLKRAVRVDRSDTDRGSVDPGPSLPERLYAARERKGVDLYRAERDTKIRARYLGALERGDYKELPGAVYTKGFLRNYALYLGLDPDDVLLQWRKERGDGKEQAPAIVVPKPIATPRKGLTFSPGIVVAALLTVVVVAFGAYLGIQVLRFSKPPTIAVTQPATNVIDVDESTTRYTLMGDTLPGATISIATPGRDPYQVTATSDGKWSADVDLRRGRNQFDVNALDPDTGKHSDDTIHLFITVPFLVIEAPTLTVDQPAEGASYENGAIPVGGKATNAATVVVSAAWVGSSGPPAAAGQATPAPPATPASVTVKVADDGSFNTPYELTAGRWTLTVTARSAEGKTASLTRNVTVAYKGVTLVVTAKGGRAWIKVWVDGKIDPGVGAAGQVISSGKTLTFTGRDSIEVRTGSSGVTYFTLNGTSLGTLGKSGVPETWLFAPPHPPEKTQRR